MCSSDLVEVVRVPDAMDPDEYLQKNSAEDLAYLLTKTRISPIEFYIHQLKPENSDNLQAQIEFIEKDCALNRQRKVYHCPEFLHPHSGG